MSELPVTLEEALQLLADTDANGGPANRPWPEHWSISYDPESKMWCALTPSGMFMTRNTWMELLTTLTGIPLKRRVDDTALTDSVDRLMTRLDEALREVNRLEAELARGMLVIQAAESFISHERHRRGHLLTSVEWADEVLRKIGAAMRAASPDKYN